MQHIGGENIRNTQREAENNTQNTDPIIILLERTVFTKIAVPGDVRGGSDRMSVWSPNGALLGDRIEAGIETEGVDQVYN